ncbi:SE1832 family protein [Paenisporosarcina sp. TG-14]|uniref:SE1832 family protein n=1 Tax=Paenisporosarcina sp. TG-14 TaxID=1231057 RepID=UPI00031EECA9|nr:SE1832 family protein [Paenisporosarcina sp. TG-14]
MTLQQIQTQIAELKMDYIRLQGDMEKMESTGHPAMIEQAEQRLGNMEVQLAELNKKLAAL